jgi:RimJ/RimL family protein N-acetyltransferase
MLSSRLRYERLDEGSLQQFHLLVSDDHVRRYLMDGQALPESWSRDQIRESEDLFARRGVGLWLAYERTTNTLVGFCGFLGAPASHPEPQLVYAMFERWSGQGYATEMGRRAIAAALTQPGFEHIFATVDEANAASCRVLEKLGFVRVETSSGAFGNVFLCRLQTA